MPRRVVAALAAILLTLFAGPAAAAALPSAAVAVGAAVATPTPPTDAPFTSDNPFIPEGNLSDCVSALPQPNCGTEAKGGWRQGLVLGVIVLGLSFVAWRITRTVRRNRRAMESTGGR